MRPHNIYIGADPGSTGAIAAVGFSKEGEVCFCKSIRLKKTTTEIYLFCSALRQLVPKENIFIAVEKVSANPLFSSITLSVLFKSVGIITTCLHTDSKTVQFYDLNPRIWKQALSLSKDKDESVELCQRIYPLADISSVTKLGNVSAIPDHNVAEAYLMTHYLKEHLLKGGN